MARRPAVLLPLLAALLLLAASYSRAADDTGTFDSKELNFTVRMPEDSVDWDTVKIDSANYPTFRVHFRSIFVDSGAWADVRIYVQKLDSGMVRKKLERIGTQWKGSLEESLENPHDRTTKVEKFAGVDAYIVNVKGIMGVEQHLLKWIICKNGEFLYTIVVARQGTSAVKDEDLTEEIDAILKSFKFHEIKRVKKGKGAGKGDAPKGPAGKKKNGKGKKEDMPGVDPKLLEKEDISSSFWRLKFTKPAGLVAEKLTQILKDNQIKWAYRGERNTISLGFRVYVWSLKNKSYTLDQLLDAKLKWAEQRFGKNLKEPIIDRKYKGLALAKKAYRLEIVGRSTRTERWIYILSECKNGRQYQLEIYTMGDTGSTTWGKAVNQLIKSFVPRKK